MARVVAWYLYPAGGLQGVLWGSVKALSLAYRSCWSMAMGPARGHESGKRVLLALFVTVGKRQTGPCATGHGWGSGVGRERKFLKAHES